MAAAARRYSSKRRQHRTVRRPVARGESSVELAGRVGKRAFVEEDDPGDAPVAVVLDDREVLFGERAAADLAGEAHAEERQAIETSGERLVAPAAPIALEQQANVRQRRRAVEVAARRARGDRPSGSPG